MSEWKSVSDASDAIYALSRSETIEMASLRKCEAILAISRIQPHSTEVRVTLEKLDALPIDIAVNKHWQTGGPVQVDRYAAFLDSGEAVAAQLWQVWELALDLFAKDWHARH